MRFVLFALLIGLSFVGHAHEFTGRVVSVSDGDTLTVLDSRSQKRKLRLAAIDAPEKKQSFSNQSRQSLWTLTQGKMVRVIWSTRDIHGRIVAKVLLRAVGCDSCEFTRDAGLLQIEAGHAWWYEGFKHEQSLIDQHLYASAQREARQFGRGLWADASPQPPWEWRKQHPNSSSGHKRLTHNAATPHTNSSRH